MRLEPEIIGFLQSKIQELIPDAEIFLFGSRTHSHAKGGDIDILVAGGRKLSLKEKIDIRLAFVDRFGERKIDILSYPSKSDDPFFQLILEDAIKLNT